MPEAVNGIWVRNVPPNNFRNIERHSSHGPAGGGGALYIEAPGSVVPPLLELLGRDPAAGSTEDFSTETRVIGDPETAAPLTWSTKSEGRMRLFQNRQSGPDVRHPAWRTERGFPKAPDNVSSTEEAAQYISDGLRVYVVRTQDNEYYAGFLVGDYPDDWPDDDVLRSLFTGNGGVRFFTEGLYLDPSDHSRPFSTEAGAGAVDEGGVVDVVDDVADAESEAAATKVFPYAAPDVAAAVDRVAMDLALEYAAEKFPDAQVIRMPHNNPGYDILVTQDGQPIRYIEVKGTTLSNPRFFLSEVERLFSVKNADLYTLVVFYELDLDAEIAQYQDRDGAITSDDLGLEVLRWKGALPPAAG